jgi:hypothetical protein
MRKLLYACAALAALTAPASAAIIDYHTFSGTSTLDLIAVPPPGNQPLNTPCLICGTNQPQQPATFGYNNYQQGGNITSFSAFSTAATGNQSLADGVEGTPYAASFLRAFVLAQLGANANFNVGIDVNTATGAGPEVLEAFYVLDTGNHTILAQYSPGPGGTPLPTLNNGTGYPDYILSGFDINRSDINANTQIEFYARWSNTSDGAESFFLVPVPGPTVGAVPEPATWAMMLIGFAGLGIYRWRKRRNEGGFNAVAA